MSVLPALESRSHCEPAFLASISRKSKLTLGTVKTCTTSSATLHVQIKCRKLGDLLPSTRGATLVPTKQTANLLEMLLTHSCRPVGLLQLICDSSLCLPTLQIFTSEAGSHQNLEEWQSFEESQAPPTHRSPYQLRS